MLIQVEVGEPIEVSSGVFKTNLKHGMLDGELSFIHGSNNRGLTLATIEESFIGDLTSMVSLIGDLANGPGKRNKTSLPPTHAGSTSSDT